MEYKDYYRVLGVKRDAAADEIKRSYRRLARKYHPDVSKEPNAEDRFKEVQEAYEVLKDPEKRQAYDQFGQDWKAGQEFRPPPDWERQFTFHGGGFTDAGEDEFSDFFKTLFGGGRPGRAGGFARSRARMRGENMSAGVRITLEDAFHGTTRTVSLETPQYGPQGRPTGSDRRTLNVRIPKGVTSGQQIRLSGQGLPSLSGAQPGDLYLEVEFEPHRLFRADGRDIYLELPVAPWEAALGRTVTVPTLGGSVDLKIPPGARSGQKLRLKGRGLPGDPPGDQYVVLSIAVPPAGTPELRSLYERLERESGFDPRTGMEY